MILKKYDKVFYENCLLTVAVLDKVRDKSEEGKQLLILSEQYIKLYEIQYVNDTRLEENLYVKR